MEDSQILNLWKSYDKKLEENLLLNRRNAADITKIKVKSFVSSMKPLKIFTIVAGVVWVGFLGILIIGLFGKATPFFLISAGILFILNSLAVGIYLYQLVLIHLVSIDEPILITQKKIAGLRSSTIWIARILFLQLPLWTIFYWSIGMFKNGGIVLIVSQFTIAILLTLLALWLFFNIKYENRDKKWFNLIFSGYEWKPVMKSMELLDQIEEYRVESK
jgi:hypothetical protein